MRSHTPVLLRRSGLVPVHLIPFVLVDLELVIIPSRGIVDGSMRT